MGLGGCAIFIRGMGLKLRCNADWALLKKFVWHRLFVCLFVYNTAMENG